MEDGDDGDFGALNLPATPTQWDWGRESKVWDCSARFVARYYTKVLHPFERRSQKDMCQAAMDGVRVYIGRGDRPKSAAHWKGLLVKAAKWARSKFRRDYIRRQEPWSRTWHNLREKVVNVLPKGERARWRLRLQRAYDRPTYTEAEVALTALHRDLEALDPSAAKTLDDGLKKILALSGHWNTQRFDVDKGRAGVDPEQVSVAAPARMSESRADRIVDTASLFFTSEALSGKHDWTCPKIATRKRMYIEQWSALAAALGGKPDALKKAWSRGTERFINRWNTYSDLRGRLDREEVDMAFESVAAQGQRAS